jgi:hypothetical protein
VTTAVAGRAAIPPPHNISCLSCGRGIPLRRHAGGAQCSSSIFRGALGAEMDRIASYFSSLGYKRASAKIYLSRIARFGRFASEHCRSGPISEGIVDGYLGTFTTDPARIGAGSALQHARRVAPERFVVATPYVVDDPDAPAPDLLFRLSERGAGS